MEMEMEMIWSYIYRFSREGWLLIWRGSIFIYGFLCCIQYWPHECSVCMRDISQIGVCCFAWIRKSITNISINLHSKSGVVHENQLIYIRSRISKTHHDTYTINEWIKMLPITIISIYSWCLHLDHLQAKDDIIMTCWVLNLMKHSISHGRDVETWEHHFRGSPCSASPFTRVSVLMSPQLKKQHSFRKISFSSISILIIAIPNNSKCCKFQLNW